MRGEALSDKELWDYYMRQEANITTEFGVGIIGIGAFFLAYLGLNPPNHPYFQILISFVAFLGSTILLLHIVKSEMEFNSFKDCIRKRNRAFFKLFDDAQSWRDSSWLKWLYPPVSWLMPVLLIVLGVGWFIVFTLDVFFEFRVLLVYFSYDNHLFAFRRIGILKNLAA
jgi:hypothetical protein